MYVVFDGSDDPIIYHYDTHEEAIKQAIRLQEEDTDATFYIAKITDRTIIRFVEIADLQNVESNE